MKILFVGSTSGTACALHYFTSLIKLGHSVIPFDPQFFDSDSLLERIGRRVRRAPSRKRIENAGERLFQLCLHNRFDMVFVMAENFFPAGLWDRIRRKSPVPPKFIYHSHDNNFSKGILKPKDFFETLTEYDFVYTTKSRNVERYKQLGQPESYFIPSAFEPSVHFPVPKAESRYAKEGLEVTFVGTYDHSREPILNGIGWKHLKVWGSHWQKSPNYLKHRDRITSSPIYYFEFADVLSHSPCSLGLLREEAEDLHTQRTFEIPACGSLQFSPRKDEILEFFEEDKEIVCFDSPEELKDKLEFYLKNTSERERLAKNGHEKCLRGNHTYLDRVSQMLKTAKLS